MLFVYAYRTAGGATTLVKDCATWREANATRMQIARTEGMSPMVYDETGRLRVSGWHSSKGAKKMGAGKNNSSTPGRVSPLTQIRRSLEESYKGRKRR